MIKRNIGRKQAPESVGFYSQGMLFLSVALSLQQKQETPQAMTIMSTTETQPTISSSFRLIWR